MADVKRADVHERRKRIIYIKIPEEDLLPGEENLCGRLGCAMYGTRDAAATWSGECAERLVNIKFVAGKATPCVFFHKQKNIARVCTWD